MCIDTYIICLLHIDSHLIFYKDDTALQWKKDDLNKWS